jgi:hypothetical protein
MITSLELPEILRSTVSLLVLMLEGKVILSRNYLLEVQLISKTGEIQESFTVVLTFQSKSLTGFSFVPVPMQSTEPGMHEIAFKTPYELPASKVQTDANELVSFIKISYMVHSTKVPTAVNSALGYGYSAPTSIPCKSLKGLNPITGNSINCTLYPGTTPYVIVKNYATLPANGEVLMYLPNKLNPTDWMEFDLRLVTKQNRLLNLISVSPYQEARFTTNSTCTRI